MNSINESSEDELVNKFNDSMDNCSAKLKHSIGDKFSAIYEEDGMRYNCTILSIIDEDTCVVEYEYYLNCEKKKMTELLPIIPTNLKKDMAMPPIDFLDIPKNCCDKAGLKSMLMSWYLCGYKTGYWKVDFINSSYVL
ncbi:hypothetical protein A3Q56_01593 [Intoshia linei]|uniref:Tudor domain-containing protein n=1 Tax=Intoshia linei TaxID=1819745 RepID=A0A177B8P4_9BILA|nr:hypothetical protein A3Q56_01593 [Intoshia linei]